ncbi:MAG: hypothetical protein WB773_22370 [Isosphaeraceae bacterium]
MSNLASFWFFFWWGIRVARGGSCFNNAGYCRPAYRFRAMPERRVNVLGFRVAAVQE